MSLTGSLFAGVSGINSNGTAIGVISDNVSNINTTGFKAGDTTFASLVTGNLTGGGALADARAEITQQGLIQATGINTDLAISGQGFFVVQNNTSGEIFYTRSGSYREDQQGSLVNAAGFTLKAWPLDNAGRLPGEAGNTNTTASQLLESLQDVNVREISGIAFATTAINLGVNLDADEDILAGAFDTVDFPLASVNNAISSTNIIVPTGPAATDLTQGDTLTVTPGLTAPFTYTYDGFQVSDAATGGTPILGATSTTATFTTATDGDAFTISVNGGTAVQFTYQQFNPNADLRTFNNMESLADAINTVSNLTARAVSSTGELYISAVDANNSLAFASVAGSVSDFTAAGPAGLNLTGVAAGADRFNTLAGLQALVEASPGISATVQSPANDSSLRINVDDPLDTVSFSDSTGGAPPGLLTEFTIGVGPFGPVYDPLATVGDNMASGIISADFTRNIRVFDSLGAGHDLRVSFAKSGNNQWLAEVFAADEEDVVTSNPNGLLAFGTLEFNGDGSLRNVSSGLTNDITIVWENEAQASTVSLDLGTAGFIGTGQTDGLSQFAGPFNVKFAEQNGAPSGELSSIEITQEGLVVANFTNGESRNVFKVPLASFPNANGLRSETGNIFNQTDSSGEFSLSEIGDAGVGNIVSSALENANVELADELTDLVIAQRAFQSNTRVITTVDELLEELNRISG
jgi:flagellar hook protein FlgE